MNKSKIERKTKWVSNLLVLYILLLIIGCAKDAPTPDESEEFYVRCIMNGETWESCCEGSSCGTWGWKSEYKLDFYESSGGFEGGGRKFCNDVDQVIALDADSVTIGQNRLLANNVVFQDNLLRPGCERHYIEMNYKHYLEIRTIDYENKIMTGGFGFTAANECGDTVRVEDGQFRVKFRFFP